jgi:hypothetical protein
LIGANFTGSGDRSPYATWDVSIILNRVRLEGNRESEGWEGLDDSGVALNVCYLDLGDIELSVDESVVRGNHSVSATSAAFALPHRIHFTSTNTDWGEGEADNVPCDLLLEAWDDAPQAEWCDLGSNESFVCPGTGTCGPL